MVLVRPRDVQNLIAALRLRHAGQPVKRALAQQFQPVTAKEVPVVRRIQIAEYRQHHVGHDVILQKRLDTEAPDAFFPRHARTEREARARKPLFRRDLFRRGKRAIAVKKRIFAAEGLVYKKKGI